ncbi:hypothetical protein B0T18DRAFT_62819 [Schizothecium vesticola]|uniref:Uncharacterized protein n=1 Tax=Schizothecium vesticola TaxID=314040 RepID=A0AA40F4I7_9PEZI|nr:hypothetical protein B0T18DRAFT_62819 [Schizothecium vesticola]
MVVESVTVVGGGGWLGNGGRVGDGSRVGDGGGSWFGNGSWFGDGGRVGDGGGGWLGNGGRIRDRRRICDGGRQGDGRRLGDGCRVGDGDRLRLFVRHRGRHRQRVLNIYLGDGRDHHRCRAGHLSTFLGAALGALLTLGDDVGAAGNRDDLGSGEAAMSASSKSGTQDRTQEGILTQSACTAGWPGTATWKGTGTIHSRRCRAERRPWHHWPASPPVPHSRAWLWTARMSD